MMCTKIYFRSNCLSSGILYNPVLIGLGLVQNFTKACNIFRNTSLLLNRSFPLTITFHAHLTFMSLQLSGVLNVALH